MDKKRKHTWTPEKALAYIGKVESGKAPQGLKFCSAYDFLRKCIAKSAAKRAEETGA